MEYNKIIIVTGASRGIGATIAGQSNIKYDNCIFLLMARSKDKLDAVKSEMNQKNPKNLVLTLQIDFGKLMSADELSELLKSTFQKFDLSKISELFAFYNHGTLKMGRVESIADDSTEQFQINVVSVWILLCAIRRLFPLNQTPSQFHINISSILAEKQQEFFSLYNSTRAARATIFKCLALEQPSIRVLNYQPGPVYTDMLKQVYESDSAVYDSFKTDFVEGKLVKPETTINLLLSIIQKNNFESGVSIDYYDEI